MELAMFLQTSAGPGSAEYEPQPRASRSGYGGICRLATSSVIEPPGRPRAVRGRHSRQKLTPNRIDSPVLLSFVPHKLEWESGGNLPSPPILKSGEGSARMLCFSHLGLEPELARARRREYSVVCLSVTWRLCSGARGLCHVTLFSTSTFQAASLLPPRSPRTRVRIEGIPVNQEPWPTRRCDPGLS